MAQQTYGSAFQKHVVACFVRLPAFYARFRGLLTADVISDPDLAKVVEVTDTICKETGGQLPTKATLYEACPKSKDLIKEIMMDDLRDSAYVATKVAGFCQYKACVATVIDMGRKIKAAEESGSVDPSIVSSLQEALRVGQDTSDVGEFLIGKDMLDRQMDYLFPEQVSKVPTGLHHLDLIMGGGLSAGELGMVMGFSKAGKSCMLAQMAYGAANMFNNKKVVYYSLEMKQRKILQRMDMRIAGSVSKKLHSDPKEFVEAVNSRHGRLIGKGNILVKSFNTRTCGYSQLCAHLSQTIAMGYSPDCVFVDYVDIMKAERRLGETRHEQASCAEDLRTLAGEFNVPVWTATQGNRGSKLKAAPGLEDVGESLEKIQIADAIVSIARTPEEREQNLSRLHVTGLRNTDSGMVIKLLDDRSRMFMKTLEIVAESTVEKKDHDKSEKSVEDRRLAKSRALRENLKTNRP